jgi:glutathione S-transferase
MEPLTLVSHPLCPYVQRVAIALAEKAVPFTRIDIDLANKPAWFLALSPTGKTPVLMVGGSALFESAAILDYLDETRPPTLHPADPLVRARHRGWIEFASGALNDIAGLYNAADAPAFAARAATLHGRFARVEGELGPGPWFAGDPFTLVDAVFAPVFRYFDVIDRIGDLGVFAGLPRVAAWRARLAARTSVVAAAAPDYPDRLRRFLAARGTHISRLMTAEVPVA